MPAPVLVRPPAPLITPAMFTTSPLVLMSAVFVDVTGRVLGELIAPPVCNVPPAKINVLVALPSPIAADVFTFKVPAPIVVAPA